MTEEIKAMYQQLSDAVLEQAQAEADLQVALAALGHARSIEYDARGKVQRIKNTIISLETAEKHKEASNHA